MHQLFSQSFLEAFGSMGRQAGSADLAPGPPAAQAFVSGESGAAAASSDPTADHVERLRQERMEHEKQSLAFFRSDDWFQDVLILSQSLAPQQELMAKILFSASIDYELGQQEAMAVQGHRSWRVTELHRQTDLNSMLQLSALNIHDEAVWPREPRTEKHFTKIFAVAMRSPATVWQLVCLRTQHFPFKMFSLLQTEKRTMDYARELLATPHCLLDEMSSRLLAAYPTPFDLCHNETFLQTLSAVALVWTGTTYSTERLHSRNARQGRAAAHTNIKTLEDLAVKHCASSGPAWLEAPAQTSVTSETRKRPLGRPPRQDSKKRRGGQGKRPRGGGGPWRAFIHHQVHHLHKRPSFGELAAEYKRLSPQQHAFYTELGEQGLNKGTCFCSAAASLLDA